jgi:SAM-dependent methyltransferase
MLASAKYHLGEILSHGRALLADSLTSADRKRLNVFLTAQALAINRARQEHLASLGLDLKGKRVLEVGAGIGLHTPFFLERGCDVVITDANPENVAEIRRRHPGRHVEQADLDGADDLRRLGTCDVVYCYGLLYHLENPERAIQRMAEVCTGQLLLETCVSLGSHPEVVFLRDTSGNNQATTGIGCRPTRLWVMEKLRRYFGHAYLSRTQPDHEDFPIAWDLPETRLLYRAVFVGSKSPLPAATLTPDIPRAQTRRR